MTMFGQDDEERRSELEQRLENVMRAMLEAGFTKTGVLDSVRNAFESIEENA